MILTGKEVEALARLVGVIPAHYSTLDIDEKEAEYVIIDSIENGRKYKLAYHYDYPEEGCIDLNDF